MNSVLNSISITANRSCTAMDIYEQGASIIVDSFNKDRTREKVQILTRKRILQEGFSLKYYQQSPQHITLMPIQF